MKIRIVAPGVTGEDLYREDNGALISRRRAAFNETRRKAGVAARQRAAQKRMLERATSAKARRG